MNVENAIYPDKEQMAGFQQSGDGGPIHIINLFKYKEKAFYEDGRESDLSGREAFYLYHHGVQDLLAKVGARITIEGAVRRMTIGLVDDLWDEVAIAVYPSRQALMNMMMMPEMAELSAHRAAGLDGQLAIETVMKQLP